MLQPDINMFGVSYVDKISDANVVDAAGNHAGLHFEPGIWAFVDATKAPLEPHTVVRMASIPHGTTITAQGLGDQAPISGGPNITPTSIVPFALNNPSSPIPFPESTLATPTPFRSPAAQIAGITQGMLDDPNSVLTAAPGGHTVLETTTLTVSTDPTPVVGGGLANTAFLESAGTAASPGNAQTTTAKAQFFIMKVQDATGKTEMWLQYTQTVLLNFGPISWPHVTVATLVQQ